MNCDTVTKQLSLMLYGELSFDEEESYSSTWMPALRAGTNGEDAGVHASFDKDGAELDPVLLANCRRNLRIATSASPRAGGPHRSAWSEFIRRLSPHGSAWNWFGKPVSAVTLIAMGFFGGRLIPPGGGALPMSRMALGDNAPVASRVRFVEPGNSGQVQIVLEETRQRVLSGDVDDDTIRTLLLRAARESSDPGVRVETMDLLKGQPQAADVKRALLHALRTDTNAGVRLKALEALRPSADDSESRQALAEVLLKDENPGVRTQAIDLLTLSGTGIGRGTSGDR